MPKLKPSDQEESNRVVRACISAGMERQAIDEEKLAVKVGVTKKTIQNKRFVINCIPIKTIGIFVDKIHIFINNVIYLILKFTSWMHMITHCKLDAVI